jgi:hypothetical protein
MAERFCRSETKHGGAGGVPLLAQFFKSACGANSMGLRFFVVPVHDSSAFEQDLNGFLARHKVVSIDRHLIDQGVNSFWAICVDYLSHTPGETGHNPNLSRSRVKAKDRHRALHTCRQFR